jgi:hypothetical protein
MRQETSRAASIDATLSVMSQAPSIRYAAKLARKIPTELATRCAVPAKSLAMSSVFGTCDSPHPPSTIVMATGP